MRISKPNNRIKKASQKSDIQVIEINNQLSGEQLVKNAKSKFFQNIPSIPDPSSIKLDETLENVSKMAQQKVREQCRLIVTLIITNLVTSTLTIGANYFMNKFLPFNLPSTASASTSSTSVSLNTGFNLTETSSESLTLEIFSSGWTNLQAPYIFEDTTGLFDQLKIASFESIVSVNLNAKFVKILVFQSQKSSQNIKDSQENWTKITVKNGLKTFVHWLHFQPTQTQNSLTQSFVIPCEATREIRIKRESKTTTEMRMRFYVTAYKD